MDTANQRNPLTEKSSVSQPYPPLQDLYQQLTHQISQLSSEPEDRSFLDAVKNELMYQRDTVERG